MTAAWESRGTWGMVSREGVCPFLSQRRSSRLGRRSLLAIRRSGTLPMSAQSRATSRTMLGDKLCRLGNAREDIDVDRREAILQVPEALACAGMG